MMPAARKSKTVGQNRAQTGLHMYVAHPSRASLHRRRMVRRFTLTPSLSSARHNHKPPARRFFDGVGANRMASNRHTLFAIGGLSCL